MLNLEVGKSYRMKNNEIVFIDKTIKEEWHCHTTGFRFRGIVPNMTSIMFKTDGTHSENSEFNITETM